MFRCQLLPHVRKIALDRSKRLLQIRHLVREVDQYSPRRARHLLEPRRPRAQGAQEAVGIAGGRKTEASVWRRSKAIYFFIKHLQATYSIHCLRSQGEETINNSRFCFALGVNFICRLLDPTNKNKIIIELLVCIRRDPTTPE